ncbi:hypothetical protein RFM68_04800 [Mesorhizobium sp. MSK_1335]|uniref:Preprotein translocase subunit SecD n=1 Tax=Mesorhizobium montanum TaxID=3072323 RepID=A0ABU4ZEP4_9HYPH|nr:hypothetical protein [Mesorhizobium sp. MSK_1335]MDX8523819.1 hypothetical protein [Mesorhizobium sp. MSK_1335]
MILGASNAFASVSGTHILLRLDGDELISRRLEAVRDQIRMLLRDVQPRIDYSGLAASGRAVQVRIDDVYQVEAAKSALKTLTDPVAGIQEMALDGSEPGLLKVTMTDAGVKSRTSVALKQSIEIINNRLHDLGVANAVAEQADEDGILVQAPGVADLQKLGNILARPGRLSFQLVDTSMTADEAVNGRPPAGATLIYSADNPPVPYLIENRVIVAGKNVMDAQAATNSGGGEPVVAIRLDSRGTERFKWATTQNIGKPFAVILDDHVISAPIIREPIEHGTVQISGNFTAESANELALLFRTGALPARLTIVEEAR